MRWLPLALTLVSCRASDAVVCVSNDGCGKAARHDCIAPSITLELSSFSSGKALDECRRRGFLHCTADWCTRSPAQ